MLSLTRDLLKKTQEADPSGSTPKIKPLTVCFWSDFVANPSIMYELFAPNSRKLDYDPDKVKVMGTKDGMIRYVSCNHRATRVLLYNTRWMREWAFFRVESVVLFVLHKLH